jgi:hypothetical protein
MDTRLVNNDVRYDAASPQIVDGTIALRTDYWWHFPADRPRNGGCRLIIDDTFPQTRRFRSQCHNVQSGETAPKPLTANPVTSR